MHSLCSACGRTSLTPCITIYPQSVQNVRPGGVPIASFNLSINQTQFSFILESIWHLLQLDTSSCAHQLYKQYFWPGIHTCMIAVLIENDFFFISMHCSPAPLKRLREKCQPLPGGSSNKLTCQFREIPNVVNCQFLAVSHLRVFAVSQNYWNSLCLGSSEGV